MLDGSLKGKRVLVVEDEFFLADDLSGALQRAGAQVVGPVPNVDEALALLEETCPDAAVVDINLKGEAGFRVPDRLAQLGVPFLFATGYDAGIIPERFRDVLRWEKPFRTEGLLGALERLLSAGSAPRAGR